MKVWITKYALSKGIIEEEAGVERGRHETGMISIKRGSGWYDHFHGNEWHESFDSARFHAEKMRVARITSLKKQVARLEKMSFVQAEVK